MWLRRGIAFERISLNVIISSFLFIPQSHIHSWGYFVQFLGPGAFLSIIYCLLLFIIFDSTSYYCSIAVETKRNCTKIWGIRVYYMRLCQWKSGNHITKIDDVQFKLVRVFLFSSSEFILFVSCAEFVVNRWLLFQLDNIYASHPNTHTHAANAKA